MISTTYSQVKQVITSMYGKWWVKPYDLNVFGIRKNNPVPDKFDDTFGIAYTDPAGNDRCYLFPCSTDPGLYYLKNPLNPEGTFIMKEGYYPKLWTPGKHKGYDAMIQVGKCQGVRDNNLDGRLDFEGKKIVTVGPEAGINLHKAIPGKFTLTVGMFSAGCQVLAAEIDFLYVLHLIAAQQVYRGTGTVSYTLLNEKDFA